MHKSAVIIVLLAFAALVATVGQSPAQDSARNEAFIGPVVKITSIDQRLGVMAGLRGSWPVGRSLALGFGLYTLLNKIDAPEGVLPQEGPLDIDLSYLGLELEYFLNPESQTRFSLSALLGGAATRFVKDTGSTFKSSQQVWETAFLWVAEPGVNAEWTIVKWLRLTAGVSYRLASKPNKEWLEDVNFSGPTATIAFKF
jgi:hypothetical protein